MKYLDSNVFLHYILDPESGAKRIAAKNLLIKVAEGSVQAATSLLTWDEVVWTVRKKLGREIAREEGKKFLEFPNLRLLNVSESTMRTAQEAIERRNLNPRDAIHFASCLENGIDEIVSDDSDFDAVKGIRSTPI